MKKLLVCAVSALLAGGMAFAEQFADISVSDLKTAIDQKKVVVLDCNGSDSYKQGHIPGAIDYDAHETDLARLLPRDKNTLVVAYCGGPKCNAYKHGASAVTALGYSNVKHLSAGISGWHKAKMPVEKK